MTKKDYVLLAAALARPVKYINDPIATVAARRAWRETCANVADALAADNANFQRDRFLKACGALA